MTIFAGLCPRKWRDKAQIRGLSGGEEGRADYFCAEAEENLTFAAKGSILKKSAFRSLLRGASVGNFAAASRRERKAL